MKDDIIKYLRDQKAINSYEQTAMSGAAFAQFLDGLLWIIDPPKPRPCQICGSEEHTTIDHEDEI